MGPVFFWIAAFMIVFAPLVRGGNRPIPLFVLEMSATVVLAASVLASRPARPRSIPLLAAAIAVLLASAACSWCRCRSVCGLRYRGTGPMRRRSRARSDRRIDGTPSRCMQPPPNTPRSPCCRPLRCSSRFAGWSAAQCGGSCSSSSPLRSAKRCWESSSSDRLQVRRCTSEIPGAGGVPVGTYVNKNHFAALLAMALPPTMALWATEMVPARNARGEEMHEHPRHRDARIARRLVLAAIGLVLVTALLLTRSRAGIACGLFVLALPASHWSGRRTPYGRAGCFS